MTQRQHSNATRNDFPNTSGSDLPKHLSNTNGEARSQRIQSHHIGWILLEKSQIRGDRLGVRHIFEPCVGSHDSDGEAHIFAPWRIVQVPATTQLRQSNSFSRVRLVESRLQFCLQQAFLQSGDLSFHDGTDCDMVLDQLFCARLL